MDNSSERPPVSEVEPVAKVDILASPEFLERDAQFSSIKETAEMMSSDPDYSMLTEDESFATLAPEIKSALAGKYGFEIDELIEKKVSPATEPSPTTESKSTPERKEGRRKRLKREFLNYNIEVNDSDGSITVIENYQELGANSEYKKKTEQQDMTIPVGIVDQLKSDPEFAEDVMEYCNDIRLRLDGRVADDGKKPKARTILFDTSEDTGAVVGAKWKFGDVPPKKIEIGDIPANIRKLIETDREYYKREVHKNWYGPLLQIERNIVMSEQLRVLARSLAENPVASEPTSTNEVEAEPIEDVASDNEREAGSASPDIESDANEPTEPVADDSGDDEGSASEEESSDAEVEVEAEMTPEEIGEDMFAQARTMYEEMGADADYSHIWETEQFLELPVEVQDMLKEKYEEVEETAPEVEETAPEAEELSESSEPAQEKESGASEVSKTELTEDIDGMIAANVLVYGHLYKDSDAKDKFRDRVATAVQTLLVEKYDIENRDISPEVIAQAVITATEAHPKLSDAKEPTETEQEEVESTHSEQERELYEKYPGLENSGFSVAEDGSLAVSLESVEGEGVLAPHIKGVMEEALRSANVPDDERIVRLMANAAESRLLQGKTIAGITIDKETKVLKITDIDTIIEKSTTAYQRLMKQTS